MRYPINDFPRTVAGTTDLAGQSTPSTTASTTANERFNELLDDHNTNRQRQLLVDHVNDQLDTLDRLAHELEVRPAWVAVDSYLRLHDELLTLEEEHGSPVTELLHAAGLPTQHEPSS